MSNKFLKIDMGPIVKPGIIKKIVIYIIIVVIYIIIIQYNILIFKTIEL